MHIPEAAVLRDTQQIRNGMVGSAIKTFGSWLNRSRLGHALRDEFATVSADELAMMARDVDVEPLQLRALSKAGTGPAKLLTRMLAALRIDPNALNTMDVSMARHLQATCSLCASKSRCRRSLAAGAAATAYREFCPNAATLDALRA
jgi:hypothetical protein